MFNCQFDERHFFPWFALGFAVLVKFPNYEFYKRWKENNYIQNKLPLISLYPADLKNLRDRLTDMLRQLWCNISQSDTDKSPTVWLGIVYYLLDFLLQRIKLRGAEELAESNTLANFFIGKHR